MYYSRKLKQDFRIAGLIPAIIIVTSFFLAWILFGIRTGYFVLSIGFLLYAVFSLFIYYRTRNISYVAEDKSKQPAIWVKGSTTIYCVLKPLVADSADTQSIIEPFVPALTDTNYYWTE